MTPYLIAAAIVILCNLLFLFLVSPSDRKHKNVSMLKGAYIAHRGLHDEKKGIPENTLAAFSAAVEKGYPIEFDIHLTRDGKVVVFHDHDLKRLCGSEAKVEELTLAELKEFSILGTKEKIPSLQEVLDLVDGKVFLLVEFKVKSNAKELCKAANDILSGYKGIYFIQSFHPQVPGWYKIHKRGICRGLLGAKFPDRKFIERLPGKMVLNFIARPDFIAFRHKEADAKMWRFAAWLGAERLGWTYRDKKELEEGKKLFDGYIFEGFEPKV